MTPTIEVTDRPRIKDAVEKARSQYNPVILAATRVTQIFSKSTNANVLTGPAVLTLVKEEQNSSNIKQLYLHAICLIPSVIFEFTLHLNYTESLLPLL